MSPARLYPNPSPEFTSDDIDKIASDIGLNGLAEIDLELSCVDLTRGDEQIAAFTGTGDITGKEHPAEGY